MAIQIKTSENTGYRDRTIENASSELFTIAFAIDFTTAGERLTRSSVERAHRHYVPVQLNQDNIREWSEAHKAAGIIINAFKEVRQHTQEDFGVNIAGNSLASFSKDISQLDIDLFMARTLLIVQHSTQGEILRIRSGGQTGIDEAGVKAADVLRIPALVNGPKDYLFRIREGSHHRDIKNDKNHYIQRFDDDTRHRLHIAPIGQINEQLMICPYEVRADILKGIPYEITPGNFVELAQNTYGEDRLWVNDELFDAYFNIQRGIQQEELPFDLSKVYFSWEVQYTEYMADSSKITEIFASSLEEAEKICRSEFYTDLVYGSFPAEIERIEVKKVFIEGKGYNIDPSFGMSENPIQEYLDLLKRQPDAYNIWYGSGENPELSNFAIRPFPFRTGENDYEKFQSVEQAFQYMKTLPSFSVMDSTRRREIQEAILKTSDGAELKQLGRSVPGLNRELWNRNSTKLMRDLIRMSFDYNPDAKANLLKTGNAQFIHRQEQSSWRVIFPNIMSGIRDDIRRRQQVKENYNNIIKTGQSTKLHFYEGDIKPHKGVIFVFGSNSEGRHGLGAAKVAKEQFGAIYGQGEGMQGNSYAIPTKDLRVKENKGYRSIPEVDIIKSISKMYECAKENPHQIFCVAYRNPPHKYTLNGYTGKEMISMFLKAGSIPDNICFSNEWKEEMTRQLNKSQGKTL